MVDNQPNIWGKAYCFGRMTSRIFIVLEQKNIVSKNYCPLLLMLTLTIMMMSMLMLIRMIVIVMTIDDDGDDNGDDER